MNFAAVKSGKPYGWLPLDIKIESQVHGLGVLKFVVRPTTAHCFFWVDDVYIGRTWSLNQIKDDVTFVVNENNVVIHFSWLPIWKARVSINDVCIGDLKFKFGTFYFWMTQIVIAGIFLIVSLFIF